jgi:hypothetical protein
MKQWIAPMKQLITPTKQWIAPMKQWITPTKQWMTPMKQWIIPTKQWITPIKPWIYLLYSKIYFVDFADIREIIIYNQNIKIRN